MGFATILSLLAFFVAMVALWLTSDIVKKVENQNEKFVRAHLASLREELRDMDKMIHKTTRLAKGQEESQATLDKRLNEHTKTFEDVRARIAQLNEELEDLDRSIPPRYRVRAVKGESKGKLDSKPSLQ